VNALAIPSGITYTAGSWIQNYGPFKIPAPYGRTIHTLECDAKPGIAKQLSVRGGYLDTQKLGPQRMVDPTERVATMAGNLRGGHAGTYGNNGTVGYEISGRAAWSRSQWLDESNPRAALENAARCVAEDMVRDGWSRTDIRWLSGAQIIANNAGTAYVRGLLEHNDVSEFLGLTNHWDPGPGFPGDVFLERVAYWYDQYSGAVTPTPTPVPKPPAPKPPTDEEYLMAFSKEAIAQLKAIADQAAKDAVAPRFVQVPINGNTTTVEIQHNGDHRTYTIGANLDARYEVLDKLGIKAIKLGKVPGLTYAEIASSGRKL